MRPRPDIAQGIAAILLALWLLGLVFAIFIPHEDWGHGNGTQQHADQERTTQGERWWDSTFGPTVKPTDVVVAVFTGFLFLVGCAQVHVYHRQREIMASQTRILEEQSRTTKAIQRAFLTIEAEGIDSVWGDAPILKIRIVNSGGLPATKIRWLIEGTISANNRLPTFDVAAHEHTMLRSTNLLAPKGEMRRFFEKKFGKGATAPLDWGGAFLYVWGIVYYLDGFGKERWTKFCHRYQQDCIDTQFRFTLVGAKARQHQYGNGTDEDEGG
jgi:hypothetical protein